MNGCTAGTIIASEFVDSDWALSFVLPGLVMGAVGALVWLLLPPEPATVGLGLAIGDRGSVSYPYYNNNNIYVRSVVVAHTHTHIHSGKIHTY